MLTFRSTADADSVRLDLSGALDVTSASLDGEPVDVERDGKDLVLARPVAADERHELELAYRGTPEPVASPTDRDDLVDLGFNIDGEHQVFTIQEPYGAYTWYAVNDHPSDKALYDVTVHAPAPWTGVSNGEQVLDETRGDVHTTGYRLAEPAASYLVTLAVGDYERTEDTGPSGTPITYWTFRGDPFPEGLRSTPDALAWLEERLGPYPFDTAGHLVVDWSGGLESQTMITLGRDSRSTDDSTVLHELAHQWYGDQVTPDDWRDVWMNEGMATYLQLMWEAEQAGYPFDDYLADYAGSEARARADSGPPGDFDPDEFVAPNVYYSGAFLWHAIRQEVGDDAFWTAVRDWPTSQDNRSTDRETLLAFLETSTGTDLDDVWDAWLLGETSPPFPS